ncbi:MAG TPA: class I SAM-dependent methyltransferase, partial [Desulfomonilia bacterium]|nr:class I SAM-dependent methyltransferase [Desulfomonilia bacterium]
MSQTDKVKTIESLHRTHTGKSSDKYASYLTVYDAIFPAYQDKPVVVLEIGVQNGGSLEVWSEYFSNAEKIIGCDIDPKCSGLSYADKRIHVVVGDINVEDTFRAITTLSPDFDIIIDDASHISDNIIRTFLIYFPLLKPGGIYVVEDTHTMYWPDYQGGVTRQTTAHAFFKLFVDLINYEHWRDDLSLESLFAAFPAGCLQPFLKEGWVESIGF